MWVFGSGKVTVVTENGHFRVGRIVIGRVSGGNEIHPLYLQFVEFPF